MKHPLESIQCCKCVHVFRADYLGLDNLSEVSSQRKFIPSVTTDCLQLFPQDWDFVRFPTSPSAQHSSLNPQINRINAVLTSQQRNAFWSIWRISQLYKMLRKSEGESPASVRTSTIQPLHPREHQRTRMASARQCLLDTIEMLLPKPSAMRLWKQAQLSTNR